MIYRWRWVFALLSSSLLAAAGPAPVHAQSLELVAKSSLGGGGQNGDVAIVGNTAVVGSGSV